MDYQAHLRGPSNNKRGGYRGSSLKPLRGSKFGAAGPCRSLSRAEREAWALANGFSCS